MNYETGTWQNNFDTMSTVKPLKKYGIQIPVWKVNKFKSIKCRY